MDSHPASRVDPDPHTDLANRDLHRLLEAIDELGRVMSMALSYKEVARLRKAQVDDMLIASKEVMVASDTIRRELKEQARAAPDPGA